MGGLWRVSLLQHSPRVRTVTGSRFSEAKDNITDYDLANSANPYACLLVSPDESKLFVACSDSALRCFSTEDGGCSGNMPPAARRVH